MPRRLLVSLLLGFVFLAALPAASRADPLDPNNYASLGSLDLASGSVTFNTDTNTVSGAFTGTGVSQSQGDGLPEVAVFTFSGINLGSGVTVNVVGSRPIALLSHSNATIDASIAVSPNSFGSVGKAGGGNGGVAFGGNGQGLGGGRGTTSEEPGGGGGGYGGMGGRGGGLGGLGGASYGSLPGVLQGGSGGGGGNMTVGGAGGGAVEIGAVGTLNLGSIITASGGVGQHALDHNSGGGGGGSGGAIVLHAQTITGAGAVRAVGGGGGRGKGAALGIDSHSGGGGGGGRIVVLVDAVTLGVAIPNPSVAGGLSPLPSGAGARGQDGASGVAQLFSKLTILPTGFARQIGADGTFTESISGYQVQVTNLGVNAGGLAFATTAVTSSHDLSLQGGLVSAGQGWTAAGGARVSGFGQVAGKFDGGAGNSIAASGGVLTLGDANSTAGFAFGGAITVAAGATLQVQDADQAALGASTTLAGGARLASLNGALLEAGQTLTASGDTVIEGSFTNQGMVDGPAGAGDLLTFADGVTGAGGYSGNIRFEGTFAPGNSPALVTFAGNATFGYVTEMELGGLAAGAEHDKIVVDGLLTLDDATLEVLYWEEFAAGAGDVFDLFDWGSLSGTFSHIYLPTLDAGLAWDISRLYADGTISVSAPIPEPETYAMLLAGLALLGFVARRKASRRGSALMP